MGEKVIRTYAYSMALVCGQNFAKIARILRLASLSQYNGQTHIKRLTKNSIRVSADTS